MYNSRRVSYTNSHVFVVERLDDGVGPQVFLAEFIRFSIVDQERVVPYLKRFGVH